jgi:hypothetical protein
MEANVLRTVYMSLLVVLVFSLLSVQVSAASEKSAHFVQDRFVIGFWVDPPSDQITSARYKEIADANFTLVHGAFGPSSDKQVVKQLDLCRNYGLKAIVVGDPNDPAKLVDHPACWGYHIVDEPPAGSIPRIEGLVNAVRKIRPGKLAYFNLFPNYASAEQLGAATYDDYVGRFARETGCDVLSMDHYPMMTPTADGRDGYCSNLAAMRKHSLANGIPFWNFFNTMPYGPQDDPTESHIRWQIYTSIAYGAKGVLYFCYWTPQGGEFPKGGAIVTFEGRKTRHYEQAKRINLGIKNLGPTLMKLTSVDVIRVKPGDNVAGALEGSPIKSIEGGGDYLIGVFKHADGRRAVMLNNYNHNYTAWPTVAFDVPDAGVVEVDAADGKEKPARDDSPAMPGLQLSLDSGEGRLFILP